MGLRRVLTSVDAAWLVAGGMIGSGIFIIPGIAAAELPGFWPLLAWGIGGLIYLAGAAVYGELGSRIPETGGDYRYLRAAYGPLAAFVNGWAGMTLTFSAAAAAQVHSAVHYLDSALPGSGLAQGAWIWAPITVLVRPGPTP